MIFLTVFILVVTASLTTIFAGNIHGYVAAIILSLDTIFFDLFWQWLRFKIVSKGKINYLIGGIIGGLVVRVISVFLFIKLGIWWLTENSPYFITFAACLLSIPLWSLIMANQFKSGAKVNDGSIS